MRMPRLSPKDFAWIALAAAVGFVAGRSAHLAVLYTQVLWAWLPGFLFLAGLMLLAAVLLIAVVWRLFAGRRSHRRRAGQSEGGRDRRAWAVAWGAFLAGAVLGLAYDAYQTLIVDQSVGAR